MSGHEYFLQPNDDALEAGECTGNPAECQCEQCREDPCRSGSRGGPTSEAGMRSDDPFGGRPVPWDGAKP